MNEGEESEIMKSRFYVIRLPVTFSLNKKSLSIFRLHVKSLKNEFFVENHNKEENERVMA
jgi:hypothetical protein